MTFARYATVRDMDGARTEAYLVDRWVNGSFEGQRTSAHFVQAIDPPSHATLWVTVMCPTAIGGGECDRDISFGTLRGLPAGLGRGNLSQLAEAGRVTKNGDCWTIIGTGHPIHSRPLPLTNLPAFEVGGNATYCREQPLPVEFVSLTGEPYAQEASRAGDGDVILDDRPISQLRPLKSSVTVPWDRQKPPGPEPTQVLGYEEVWQWLSANSTEFQAFYREHPGAFLHTTILDSSSAAEPGIPVVGPALDRHAVTRRLTIQPPTGDALILVVEKSQSTIETKTQQTEAKHARGPVALAPDQAPDRMARPRRLRRTGRASHCGRRPRRRCGGSDPLRGVALASARLGTRG